MRRVLLLAHYIGIQAAEGRERTSEEVAREASGAARRPLSLSLSLGSQRLIDQAAMR